MNLGPVQLLVIAVEDDELSEAGIVATVRRMIEGEAIGLLDFLLVSREGSGEISRVPSDVSVLGLGEGAGALVGALLGVETAAEDGGYADFGREMVAAMDGSLCGPAGGWFLADALPTSTRAAIVLVEHRWAIPLRGLDARAGGHGIFDRWIHPRDLAAIGADRPRAE